MKLANPKTAISREDELNKLSQYIFGKASPSETKLEQLPYPHVILRLLTVTRLVGSSVYFRDAYDAKEKFGPVLMPMLLWGSIRREDCFLACLGREEERWELLYMSELVFKLP